MISQPEGDDGMDSMYPSEGGAPARESKTSETVDEENDANASSTALVPKSMCKGCKVGETMKMRVVADHGDEMELECCSDSENPKEEMSSDEEIDAMDKA